MSDIEKAFNIRYNLTSVEINVYEATLTTIYAINLFITSQPIFLLYLTKKKMVVNIRFSSFVDFQSKQYSIVN